MQGLRRECVISLRGIEVGAFGRKGEGCGSLGLGGARALQTPMLLKAMASVSL